MIAAACESHPSSPTFPRPRQRPILLQPRHTLTVERENFPRTAALAKAAAQAVVAAACTRHPLRKSCSSPTLSRPRPKRIILNPRHTVPTARETFSAAAALAEAAAQAVVAATCAKNPLWTSRSSILCGRKSSRERCQLSHSHTCCDSRFLTVVLDLREHCRVCQTLRTCAGSPISCSRWVRISFPHLLVESHINPAYCPPQWEERLVGFLSSETHASLLQGVSGPSLRQG